MRPLVPVLAAISLAAALGSATAPAVAAGETCQGQPVTVVGPGDAYGRLNGTEGNDVIVTEGATDVEALGGDDLVCITVTYASVDAGAGNDTVDASGGIGGSTDLGPGSDRYLGSTAREDVAAGTGPYRQDAERDVIDTGARGTYEDFVYSGHEGDANPDDIRMGWGTLHWAGTAAEQSVVDGGTGSALRHEAEQPHLAIDNVAGTVDAGREPVLEISGFTRFIIARNRTFERLVFRGTSRDEVVSLGYARGAATAKVDLGGGDDDLHLASDRQSRRSTYQGGRGVDHVDLSMGPKEDLDLDMRRGTLSSGRGRAEVTVPVRAFEDAQVKARDIEVVGTADGNDIEVQGCRIKVTALGGKDDVSTFIQGPDQGPIICKERRMVVDGGTGNDVMGGSNGPDRLIGGPGRDSADGAEGRDTCQAEERTSCEVRR